MHRKKDVKIKTIVRKAARYCLFSNSCHAGDNFQLILSSTQNDCSNLKVGLLLTAEAGPHADAGQQPGLGPVPGDRGHQKRHRGGLSFCCLCLVRVFCCNS